MAWSRYQYRGVLPGRPPRFESAGARIRTWELLREQILSLPPLAARPPRRRECEDTAALIPLLSPRPRGPTPPPTVSQELLHRGGPPAPQVPEGRLGGGSRAPSSSVVDGRIGDTSEPASQNEGEYARCGPPPSTPNSHDNSVPDTLPRVERCIACRSAGPGQRTGRPGRGDRREIHVPRARRGPPPSRERCVPSTRCGGPSARLVSRLGLLAYGAIHRDPTDDGSAPNAVLSRRWRRHRAHGARNGWGKDRIARRDVRPRSPR